MPMQPYTVTELERYFSTAILPKEIKLDESTAIIDVKQFVNSHLGVIRQSGDKQLFSSFYTRLCRLKDLLDSTVSATLS